MTCAVLDERSASAKDMDGLRDALAKWVGGGPVEAGGANGFAKFAYREAGGQRRPLSHGDPALSGNVPPSDVAEVTLLNVLGRPVILYMNWR